MTQRTSFRDSQLSRATRAFFAFLFRNGLPVDPSGVIIDNDLAAQRRRDRALEGTALAVPTVYRPDADASRVSARADSRSRTTEGAAA